MSAPIEGVLKLGDVVHLQPVTGVILATIAGHKRTMLYGFEFLEFGSEQDVYRAMSEMRAVEIVCEGD